MKNFANLDGIKFFACAVALASLAACGGGGDGGGSGAGAGATVSGTAAKGAMLVGATVEMTCANGATLSGTTNGTGAYSAQGNVAHPCIGTATLGSVKYRGVLLSNGTANFTPLTDMLVEVVLAAAGSGTGSLTVAQFIERVRSDATFAKNVANSGNSYRTAVLDAIKAQLIAGGKTAAEADAILAAARASAFDATTFALGSDLDKVLDNSAALLQDSNGNVKATVLAVAKSAGDSLPLPGAAPTGATGGSSS